MTSKKAKTEIFSLSVPTNKHAAKPPHDGTKKPLLATLHAANRREEEDTPQNHKQQKEKGREIPRTRTYTLYQPLHMGGLRESWNLIYRTCGFQVLFISINKNWILLIILHIKRNIISPQILPKRFSLAQKLFPLDWKYQILNVFGASQLISRSRHACQMTIEMTQKHDSDIPNSMFFTSCFTTVRLGNS